MNGLNTARGDFIPGGDGILSPGGASVPGEKSPGGTENQGGGRKCSATPAQSTKRG